MFVPPTLTGLIQTDGAGGNPVSSAELVQVIKGLARVRLSAVTKRQLDAGAASPVEGDAAGRVTQRCRAGDSVIADDGP